MLFQSFPFVFGLLPLTLIFFWLAPRPGQKHAVLVMASYIFYGWWNWRFCGLLLFSTVLDFVCGGLIAKATAPRQRKALLAVSITGNLGVLGFFKYWDFFADSYNRLAEMLGLAAAAPLFHIVLPVGISFYTFQTLSYTVDIYRGHATPTRSLVKFMAFVSMFPQLVAGPIVRWTEVDEQLDRLPRGIDWRTAALGLNLFILGLSKKVLIADNVFPLADPLTYAGRTAASFWPAYFLWNFWLYYDFSSYSDMAIGLGLLLGLKLPINFNSPYKSGSIPEYWQRWHITLGSFMRDYVFIPLGGSKVAFNRVLLNTLIIFFLIGLWHGASWLFVAWGIYNGIGTCGHLIAKRRGIAIKNRALARILTFGFIINAGFIFRSTDLDTTLSWFRAARGANGLGGWPDPWVMLVLGLIVVHVHFMPNAYQWKWRFTWWEGVVMALLFVACVARFFKPVEFFYFQF